MKLNTKVRYGLRAIIDIAQNQTDEGILQKEIASRQAIPLKYLDSIITGLRNRGLIINVAGKSSGYRLTKPASDITVYDIYLAFEPELTLVHCLCDSIECKMSEDCPAQDYWFELNTTIKKVMQTSTLEEVINGAFKSRFTGFL